MDHNWDSRSLRTKASQETFISLMQLDPRPMDTASLYGKELPDLPEEEMESSSSTLRSRNTASSSTTLGLSGTANGPLYYLTRIQRYSSYTFTLFAGLHMANTSIFPLIYRSVPAYSEPFLVMAREIYQTRLTEPLLVALPVVAHVASGVAIRLIRRSQNLQRYGGATPGMYALHRSKTSSSTSSSSNNPNGWPPLSYISASGYVLVPLLASHVFINRVLPLMVEGDSSNIGLQYVAHGFARQGDPAWYAYSALIAATVGHMVWGGAKWMGITPPPGWRRTTIDRQLRKRRSRAWWSINSVVVLGTALWAAGGLGVVARWGATKGWLGKVYDNIYGQIPFPL